MSLLIKFVSIILLFGHFSLVYAGMIEGKVEVAGKNDFENIVVYLEDVKGNFSLPKKRPQMNHINLQFKPGVLAVMKGTTVDFPNSDSVFHSGFSISSANPFDLGIYGQGTEKFVYFKNAGLDELFCHIHSHMHAYVLSLDNPFFAITSKDGHYLIANVPKGTYSVQAWASPTMSVKKSVDVREDDDKSLVSFRLSPQ